MYCVCIVTTTAAVIDDDNKNNEKTGKTLLKKKFTKNSSSSIVALYSPPVWRPSEATLSRVTTRPYTKNERATHISCHIIHGEYSLLLEVSLLLLYSITDWLAD